MAPTGISSPSLAALLCLALFYVVSSFWGCEWASPDFTDSLALYGYLSAKFIVLLAIILLVKTFPASARPEKKPHPSHPDGLLTLRAFACFLVLAGHYFLVVFPYDGLSNDLLTQPTVFLLASPPWVGVWIFFTLSGYLMGKGFYTGYYTLDEHGIRRFYINRALKIVPLYLLAVLILSNLEMLGIYLPDGSGAQPITLPDRFLTLSSMLLFDYKTHLPLNLNSSLWSISTEMQFYLVAPFMAMLLSRAKPCFLILIIPAGLIWRLAVYDTYPTLLDWQFKIYTPLLSNLDLFASGMLLSRVPLGERKPRLPLALLSLAVVYGCVSFTAAHSVYQLDDIMLFYRLMPTFSGMFALYMIYLFETADRQRMKSLPWRIVKKTQFAGILTYALYCVHEPLYLSIRKIVPANLSMGQMFALLPMVLGAVVLTALAGYYLVEKPWERKRV